MIDGHQNEPTARHDELNGTELTAPVTGGSSGFGLQVTRLLSGDGIRHVLVARNKQEVQLE